MRFIVLDTLQSNWFALFIETDFYFWKIKVQRAVFESFPTQQRRKFPGKMKPFAQLSRGGDIQNRVRLFVRQPVGAANDATRQNARSWRFRVYRTG